MLSIQMIALITITVVLMVAGPVLLFVSLRYFVNKEDVTSRLTEVVTEPIVGANPAKRIFIPQAREFTDSLSKRILLPWFNWLGRIFTRLTPSGTIENLDHQLLIAGNPMNLRGREFYGIQGVFFLIGVGLSAFWITRGIDRATGSLAVMSLLVCYLLPIIWLRGRVRSRQDAIRKSLPDAFDMLAVCATAGLGFDQAMKRVSEYWDNPVGVEFGRVIAGMEMGQSREEALRDLSFRLDVSEMSSFVSFVLQTSQLGLSMTDTLRTQAEQMRMERRQRAQEQAQKVPTKMLFPMVFLIFPALMAMILGPSIPIFASVVQTMGLSR